MSPFKNDLLIYLASPLTHPEKKVRDQRYHDVKHANGLLLKAGHMVYCPIVSSYPITSNAENDWSVTFDFWGPLDLRILRCCDIFCALTIDGWKDSKGMKAEFEYAKALNKTLWTMDLSGRIGLLSPALQWSTP